MSASSIDVLTLGEHAARSVFESSGLVGKKNNCA